MTICCHLLELMIVLLFSLRSSWYAGIPYPLCSIGVRVFCLVLCLSGILGKGMLRAYPWGRISTSQQLLYYAKAVDNKLLGAPITICLQQQAAATTNTMEALDQILDYIATYPNDGTTSQASHMILATHSNASFLNETSHKAKPVPTSSCPKMIQWCSLHK